MQSDDAVVLKAAEKLKGTIRDGRTFQAGQVSVVGLDAIRRTAGERWETIGPRIRANSLSLLEGCLGPDDAIIPAGDGFLVIFAQQHGRNYEAECALIQDTLHGFYLGEEGLRAVQAIARHRTLDSKQLVNQIASVAAPRPPAESAPLDATYFPVWDAAKEALTEYWLAPLRDRAGGRGHPLDP